MLVHVFLFSQTFVGLEISQWFYHFLKSKKYLGYSVTCPPLTRFQDSTTFVRLDLEAKLTATLVTKTIFAWLFAQR